jgi:hypothetical protein
MGGRVPGGNYTRTPLREKYPVMENFTAEGSAWLKILNRFQEKEEFRDDDLVCYCFGYTKKDIE